MIFPFPFTFSKSNILVYSWRLMATCYENFYHFFLHTKSIMHQQNTMNEEDNIIRKKYILNNMTVMWVFHHINVEVAGLLACCIMQLGICFLTSWRKIQPSSPGLWVKLGLISQKMKVVYSSEMLGNNHPITKTNNPEDLLPQYDNTFATNTIFQCCVISSW
jgi:hypothetical protein